MVNLDTIKLKLNKENCLELNKKHFNENICNNNLGDKVKNYYSLDQNVKSDLIGIKEINYNKIGGEVYITISAKALREHYIKLINKNTLELLIDKIVETGVMKIDKNKFIDTASVLKCDTTTGIFPSNTLDKIFPVLETYGINSRYECKGFPRCNPSETIYFNKINKAGKIDGKLTFYDKRKELYLSRNKKLREILGNNKVNEFNNMLRVETKLTTFKGMRKAFNINDSLLQIDNSILLKDILVSKENVNYGNYKTIIDNENVLIDLFNKCDKHKKLYLLEKSYGVRGLIEYLNYDLKSIRLFLRRISPTNITQNMQRYEREIMEIQKENNDLSIGESEKCIKEIGELLKVA